MYYKACNFSNLKVECKERFCTQDETNVLNCTTILDTNLWPTDVNSLRNHGDDCLKRIADHFTLILQLHVDEDGTEGLVKQWHEVKEFVCVNLTGLSPSVIWQKVHCRYADRYPIVARVINLIRVFPFSNAIVERCFSTMNKIKTDWRAALGVPTVDMLIRILKKWVLVLSCSTQRNLWNYFFPRSLGILMCILMATGRPN